MRVGFDISFEREKDRAARKDTLEAARKALLVAHDKVCVHANFPRREYGYCDDCPCSSYRDDPLFTDQQSKIICPLRRNYSK